MIKDSQLVDIEFPDLPTDLPGGRWNTKAVLEYVTAAIENDRKQRGEPIAWHDISDVAPPRDCMYLEEYKTVGRRVLVTNNIHSEASTGQMSHVWLATPIWDKSKKWWVAFDANDNKIEGITHWLDPLNPAPQPVDPTVKESLTVAEPVEEVNDDRPCNDPIAFSKRILTAVDTYHERPDRMTRNALRSMLMDEFEDALSVVPQPIEHNRKQRGEPIAWINEDELPDNYPHEEMYPFSKVDVVRLFPVFFPETVITTSYLDGHNDGLEWAARLAEANHPLTSDWLYDDPHDLAKAIRKGPEMPEASLQSAEPVKEVSEVEAIISVLAPNGIPCFEWGHETTPRDKEILKFAKDIAAAIEHNRQQRGEPVAWLHDDPKRVDVIHDAVKNLLRDSSEAAGHLSRPLDKSERYTIPLYSTPQPAEPAQPSVPDEVEALGWFEQRFTEIETGDGDIPIPQRGDGKRYDDFLVRHQSAMTGWVMRREFEQTQRAVNKSWAQFQSATTSLASNPILPETPDSCEKPVPTPEDEAFDELERRQANARTSHD